MGVTLQERALRRANFAERFWSLVQKSDGCWLWQGRKERLGYGRFHIIGRTDGRRDGRAHHIAWMLANDSPVPDGMILLHACDTPSCVRPDHLRLGTHADNVADKVAKGRQAKGMRHGRSKLSEHDVRAIRLCLFIGISKNKLAKQYGVDHKTLSHLETRKTWRHL